MPIFIVHMVLHNNSNVHGWIIFKWSYLYSSFFYFMVDWFLFPLTLQLIKKKKLHGWMVFYSSHVKDNQIFCLYITISIKTPQFIWKWPQTIDKLFYKWSDDIFSHHTSSKCHYVECYFILSLKQWNMSISCVVFLLTWFTTKKRHQMYDRNDWLHDTNCIKNI